MRIGLYFGSFNPVHYGHLIIASHVANNTNCDQVWFIVTPQNPLKTQKSLLNESHRKHLIDLAIENDPQLRSSNIEFNLPRPSYTIDTLTYLSDLYPQHSFSVIMGSDAFSNIKKWKNWETLLKNYEVIIYERPGFSVDKALLYKNTSILKAPLLQISSTMIREMIKNKKPIRYLLPDIIIEEIHNQQYYD
ncbi:MAG: nicotinate (nicotinamide) nucleotide adenylyltransferase [Ginsengibacter sp.]